MSPARIIVRAVVVSDGRSPHLLTCLESVLAQDPAPDEVHLALTADVEEPLGGWGDGIVVHRVDARDHGAAVDAVLANLDEQPHELLWLLHDDTAPMPGALAALEATSRKRRLAGVVGAAQVRWDSPDRLVALGVTTTRVGARRIGMVEAEDVDQGQYAERDDVLAVSLAGALVRRELWALLEGVDGAVEGWAASLDFCRRAWRAGYDVVAVPQARVRHSQERLYGRRGGSGGGRRSTYGVRRAAEWYHACAFAPWWAVMPLLAWAVVSALGRALLRIAQNEPRLLVADLLVPWRLLTELPRLPRSRRRMRRAGRDRTAERRLLAGPRQVARHVRALEWGARSQRAMRAPLTQVERAELARLTRRRRMVLATLAIALVAFSVAWHPGWLPAIARGEMLTGGVLGATDVPLGVLWDRALTGWTDQAFGAPAIDAGLALLLIPLAAVPGGLATGLAVLLAFSPLLAGLGAWAAAGAFTRLLPVRALVAAGYALWPIALDSITQGRVAAVLVHLVLPWAVLALARAGGWQVRDLLGDGVAHPGPARPSRSAAMGLAATLAIVVAAVPALVGLAVIAIAAFGAMAGAARWRVWAAALPALVVAAPGVLAASRLGFDGQDGLAVLAREPGPSGLAEPLAASDLLLGALGDTELPLLIDGAARALPVVVLVAAFFAAALGPRRWLAAGALLLAAGATGVATAVQAVTLSPDAGADAARGNGWYGPAMTVAAMCLLVVIAAAVRPVVGAGAMVAVRRAAGWIVVVALVAVGAGSAAAQAWPGREAAGDIAPASRDVLPLVASLEVTAQERQRAIVISGDGQDYRYAVLGFDGTEVLSSAGTLLHSGAPAARSDARSLPGPAGLADAVATLVAGGEGAASDLAAWGIGVVVAAPGSEAVADVLTQNAELRLMGASDRGTSWRIGAAEGDARVSRAWFEADQARTAVPMGRSAATWTAPGAGVMVLAVAADEGWQATLDGVPVPGEADDLGRQTFDVPAGGELHVVFDDRGYRVWFWAALGMIAWTLLGSVPVGSRRARREESS